jgi:hypothetical protein
MEGETVANPARGISLYPLGIKRKIGPEGFHVKTILAAFLVIALGITGVSLWGEVHSQRMSVSSSQIFIHGTPVCVIRQAGEIYAAVGICGTLGRESGQEDLESGRSFHHEEDPSTLGLPFGLPPGHPPLDSDPDFRKGHRILI